MDDVVALLEGQDVIESRVAPRADNGVAVELVLIRGQRTVAEGCPQQLGELDGLLAGARADDPQVTEEAVGLAVSASPTASWASPGS